MQGKSLIQEVIQRLKHRLEQQHDLMRHLLSTPRLPPLDYLLNQGFALHEY